MCESAVKTVRFLNTYNKEICDNKCETLINGETGSNSNPTINMVQNLVPHLPGLEKDKIYIISGPFPNYEPVTGHSQLLMATPVSVGATIIAVPSGPPPPPPPTMKPAGSPTAAASQPSQQAASFQPAPPHMLHWDCHHPGGQMLPLRQPVPPVYYNTSSGSGSISESSSTSGDQEGPQLYLQPEYHPVYGHLDMTRELRGMPPQYCHQLGPVYLPQHNGHIPI